MIDVSLQRALPGGRKPVLGPRRPSLEVLAARNILRLLELAGVNVEYRPPDDVAWSISAASGSTPKDGSRLDLAGTVEVRSVPTDGSEPRIISTESLRFWPDTSKVETDAPGRFRLGDWHIDAVGLRADLKGDTLKLESQVNGTFAPR